MDYKRILYEKVEPYIVKITLNRPEKRNAQDDLMFEEMNDAFFQADMDDDVRVIILAGAGKDFSSGDDISGKGESAQGPIIGKAMATKLTGMEKRLRQEDYIHYGIRLNIRNVSKPTIAMVQGRCIAGGWLTASMCDLIVASEDAEFSNPIASFTRAALTVLFEPYDVGFRKAKEILWTCEPVLAPEAKQLGLVSRVVPREKLEAETLALARKIVKNSPVAISLVKRSLNHAWDEMGQRNAREYHMLVHQLSHCSDETKRGPAPAAETIIAANIQEIKAVSSKVRGAK